MTNVVQCILAAWPQDGNNDQLVHKFGADIRGSQHFGFWLNILFLKLMSP